MAPRLSPADAANMLEEAKARKDSYLARERVEAERRRLAVEAREEAASNERLRREDGLRNQTRATLTAAIGGASSAVIKGELFGDEDLIRRGFLILYRRPLNEEEVRARQALLADIEAEAKSNAEEVDSAIDNWIKGIACQDRRIYGNQWLLQELTDTVHERIDEYIEIRRTNGDIEDYLEDSDNRYEAESEGFVRFLSRDLAALIPEAVEWRALIPEVPRVRRAIDRLMERRLVLESRKSILLGEIENGLIIGGRAGASSRYAEISWEHRNPDQIWRFHNMDLADAHQWLSGPSGQVLFGCIEKTIEESIEFGAFSSAEFVVVERPEDGWGLEGCAIREDDSDRLIDCPPGEILAQALELLGWKVQLQAPNSHRTVLTVSW